MSASRMPTTSSWVNARTMSRPLRSLKRRQLRADRVVPAARPPDVGRVDDRHLHLLAADPVLLLADDLLDPVADPLAERQQRIDAGPELADVAGSHQQPMRRHLGLGRVVAERGEEEVGQSHGRVRIAGHAPARTAAGSHRRGGRYHRVNDAQRRTAHSPLPGGPRPRWKASRSRWSWSSCWPSSSTTSTGSTTRPTPSRRRWRPGPSARGTRSSWPPPSTSSGRSPGRPWPRRSGAAWSTTRRRRRRSSPPPCSGPSPGT